MLAAPPRYLLDTNVLVHYVRRNALGQWIEDTYDLLTAPTTPLISVVTEGEIRSFARQLNWGAAKTRQMLTLLHRFVTVPLDFGDIIERYAEIDAHSRSVGREMGKNDVWIAATAAAAGSHLLTTDRDFNHLSPRLLTQDYIDPTVHP